MSWKNIQQYNDTRQLKEIPSEEVLTRIDSIINSNPIINGSIEINDGSSRQTVKKMVKVKYEIRKHIRMLYKGELSVKGNRDWKNFQNMVSQIITDFLIYENYKFYLQGLSVSNNYTVEKGSIWFLPSYFCLKVKSVRQSTLELFSNRDRNYPHKEFYCESEGNQRHPCLVLEVEPEGEIFWVLMCSNSPYFGINESISLKKNGFEHKQYVALDWKVKASRKMLDVGNVEAKPFSIDPDELARIEAKVMLANWGLKNDE